MGLGQHGSEAVGPGFESLACQIFLRFRIVTPPPSTPLIHKIFRYQEYSETQKGSPTKFLGTVRQKIVYTKSCYPPTPPPPRDWKSWYPPHTKNFSIPKILSNQEGSTTKFFGKMRWKIFPTENRNTPYP